VVGLMIEASNQPGSTSQGIAIPVTRIAPILSGVVASPIARTAIPVLASFSKGPIGKGPIVVDSFQRVAVTGCVFLGKRSASVTKRAPDMPFGLAVLQTLMNNEKRRELIGKALPADVAVNLRTDCPTISDGSAYYAAAKAQLSPGDDVTPSEILALSYLDDVFFWARGTARSHVNGPNIK
jgi:hypothetical protein